MDVERYKELKKVIQENPDEKTILSIIKEYVFLINYIDKPSSDVIFFTITELLQMDYAQNGKIQRVVSPTFFKRIFIDLFSIDIQERLIKHFCWKNVPEFCWAKVIKEKYSYLFSLSKVRII